MKLKSLLNGIEGLKAKGNLDTDVKGITHNSKNVKEGDMFIAIKGFDTDGHKYIKDAVENGAKVIVIQEGETIKKSDIKDDTIVISAPDTRIATSKIACHFYNNPSSTFTLIGVTGTKGKTTTTYMVKSILENAGYKVGLIGTIHNEIGDMVLPAKNTTPDPGELHVLFMRMAQAGCEYVVMETSSHALDQKRLAGCRFAVGVFTNLTQDHLDYHGTMENYYQAKKLLFQRCDTAIIDTDDEYGKRLYGEVTCPRISYGSSSQADFYADAIKLRADGTSFWLCCGGKSYPVNLHLTGMFNVSNALAAVASCHAVGLSMREIRTALETCTGVRGRCEVIPPGRDFTVICDYAHTPDAVENILRSVKEYTKGRLICLFGCGGNRDATKRPKMAKAAAKYADFLVITSDNPRDEEPEAIVADILTGLEGSDVPYEVVIDRKDAILRSMQMAQPGDVIVLAGKGHEDYQVLKNGVHIHMDEREIVRDCLPLVPER